MCFLCTKCVPPNQGLCQLFLKVSGDLRSKLDTPNGVIASLKFQKQCMRQGCGPCKEMAQDRDQRVAGRIEVELSPPQYGA